MMPPSSSYAERPAIRMAYENAGIRVEQDGLTIIRFGEFLVERGAIDRRQLLQALMVHHLHGGRLGEAVRRLGFCDSQKLESLAAEYHGLGSVDL